MISRAYRIAKRFFPHPDPEDTDVYPWVDRRGRTRTADCTWDDTFERRWCWSVGHADNLAVCSCWGCGNPRRHFGTATMQERRFGADADCQMAEEGLRYGRGRYGSSYWA